MSARGSRGSGTDEAVDVDALVDELFALPLEQFVVARTAASKRIKASGDAVGAERVGRLAKPTVAAWVVNQVARERAEDVEALVRLGDELRDATEDRDRTRIRTLDRLRRERVERVVGELRDAGEVAGRSVSAAALDRVAETLTAAVMDADAGALVRAGRLSQALQHVGFGIVDEGGEPADVVELRARTGAADAAATSEPKGGGRRGKRSSGGDSADDDAVEEAVAAAEREVEESAAEVDRLEAERDDADARVREAGDAVGQVEDELGRVEDELARLADERDTLRARLAEARDAESAAREALDAVDERLDAAEERAAAARKARRAARR